MLSKTKRKLARWRCYQTGHHYTYQELQKGMTDAFLREDEYIECKRCAKKTHVEESSHPKIASARAAGKVKELYSP